MYVGDGVFDLGKEKQKGKREREKQKILFRSSFLLFTKIVIHITYISYQVLRWTFSNLIVWWCIVDQVPVSFSL